MVVIINISFVYNINSISYEVSISAMGCCVSLRTSPGGTPTHIRSTAALFLPTYVCARRGQTDTQPHGSLQTTFYKALCRK